MVLALSLAMLSASPAPAAARGAAGPAPGGAAEVAARTSDVATARGSDVATARGSDVATARGSDVSAARAEPGVSAAPAGNLSALGEGAADWSPAGIAMSPLSPTRWTAVVTATADTSLSYKYDLGGSWDNVEETADCGYVANRTMSVAGGSVGDTVAAWAGLGGC
jgi:hypothetical protein